MEAGRQGAEALQAAGIGALTGPMQPLGRLVEMTLASRYKALHVGFIAIAMLPLLLFAHLTRYRPVTACGGGPGGYHRELKPDAEARHCSQYESSLDHETHKSASQNDCLTFGA